MASDTASDIKDMEDGGLIALLGNSHFDCWVDLLPESSLDALIKYLEREPAKTRLDDDADREQLRRLATRLILSRDVKRFRKLRKVWISLGASVGDCCVAAKNVEKLCEWPGTVVEYPSDCTSPLGFSPTLANFQESLDRWSHVVAFSGVRLREAGGGRCANWLEWSLLGLFHKNTKKPTPAGTIGEWSTGRR